MGSAFLEAFDVCSFFPQTALSRLQSTDMQRALQELMDANLSAAGLSRQ